MVNINGLNPVQKEAVLQTDGPVMILAGAGSGKTKTLVTRITYLLDEKNLSPHQLLALTFSNKAAREMRERIAAELPHLDIGTLQITTFHAFCARLLRSEANYLGLSRNFTIYDEGESKAIAKSLLERRGISTKEINPFEILAYIDTLKNNGFYPGRVMAEGAADPTDEYFGYFEEYESELHRANAVDFGGLITAVIQLFEKFPEVLSRYQNRFHYVLVDEYQDTNRAQFELVRMLCGKRRNICVVGDEDQSIYSWRGADIRNILDFEKIFPEVKVLKLEQNYRSSKTIIQAASCVIEKNIMRKGKQMWTDNPEGDAIEIIECFNDKEEAEFVAQEVAKIHREGVPYKEMAIFYRSNAQARLLEDSLRKYKIHYRVVGGVKFYERKEIKDMLSYLRLIINAKDSLALSRIINVPARGVGATSLRKLEIEAVNGNTSLWDIIERIVSGREDFSHIKLSAKIKSSLSEFVTLINELRVMDDNKVKPSTIYEKVLHESGYYAFLKANKDYETMARLENLDELLNAITQFEESTPMPSLQGFLETITLDANSEFDEDAISNQGQISLMTVHGAKGLEFTHAFVVGAEENVFPSYRSVDSGDNAMEEERRLFYVAMTRAMKKLYITFAQGRMLFGQVKFNGPSRFLDEIPEALFSWKKLSSSSRSNEFHSSWGGRHDDDYDPYDQSQETKYDDEPVVYRVKETSYSSAKSAPKETWHQPKFPKGSSVIHSLYGKGKVEESEGSGSDEKVLIKFADGARKKFMVKFAPITLA
jgi:DNA helicase-2/ATP-dependent DNA helicase PcrA